MSKDSCNVFVISDTHFWHKNIIEYENRPFKDLIDMEQKMVELWNNKVMPDDIIYILGDFSFGNIEKTENTLKKLNGHKILVLGNHDNVIKKNKFDKFLFDVITNFVDTEIFGIGFLMCHYPLAVGDWSKINLYGHIHSNKGNHRVDNLPENSYNCCADVNNYTPVNIKDIIKLKINTLKVSE